MGLSANELNLAVEALLSQGDGGRTTSQVGSNNHISLPHCIPLTFMSGSRLSPRGRPLIGNSAKSILSLIHMLRDSACFRDLHVNHPILHTYGKPDQPAAFRIDP